MENQILVPRPRIIIEGTIKSRNMAVLYHILLWTQLVVIGINALSNLF